MYDERVRRSSDLLALGYSHDDLVRMWRSGTLHRPRHGALTAHRPSDGEQRHRQLIEGSLPVLDPGSVLSHASAAVLHGLPTWDRGLDRVHVIRERDYGGRLGSVVHLHPMVLPVDETAVVDGVLTTSLARTVVDCIRTLPFDRGLAVGDAGLRLGVTQEDLWAVLRRKPRRVGNPRARQVVELLDGASESVGESISRARMMEQGLATPTLQHRIRDPMTGLVIARVDFYWEKLRTVGEFDGEVKYGRLLQPGESAGDVVFKEKIREDRIRDTGHSVVRWISADFNRFDVVAARLRQAFARAERFPHT